MVVLPRSGRAQLQESEDEAIPSVPGYSVGAPLPEFHPTMLGACHALLAQGSAHLKALQAATGEEELIDAWAAELTLVRAMM